MKKAWRFNVLLFYLLPFSCSIFTRPTWIWKYRTELWFCKWNHIHGIFPVNFFSSNDGKLFNIEASNGAEAPKVLLNSKMKLDKLIGIL
ncbi:hypothetical protein ABE083_05710 [Bacillus mycoides]|uniref:Uncharacterized protein n=1 Tax=Bacillus mycoides TaxID=1405 RepID=A0A1S9TD66_BACMY|nr:hypothetical protein BW900_07660 [Bacillus mycoides]